MHHLFHNRLFAQFTQPFEAHPNDIEASADILICIQINSLLLSFRSEGYKSPSSSARFLVLLEMKFTRLS